MRTKDEMREYARGLAEAIFYCDDECDTPWEPFEDWDEDTLEEALEDVAQSIFDAMHWVQEGALT